MSISRRAFIGGAVAAGVGATATTLGARHLLLESRDPFDVALAPADSVLRKAAADCPIDTVVVVMMENRSFDHYLGWLADDAAYIAAGRSKYGATFAIDAQARQTFPDTHGRPVATRPAGHLAGAAEAAGKVETRGCSFKDPGHGWSAGRVQRDQGFLASGSGNDTFALSYYSAADLPVYAALARRFTVFDRWHASLLGPTFPNRQYLISAQSEGLKTNPRLSSIHAALNPGLYRADTIFDRLNAAHVPVGYYYTNSPLLALWGADRLAPAIHSLDQYFMDAASGTLPRVVFLEPFGGEPGYGTDDHPWGDIGIGQRWVREVFRAFVESPHWQRGAFVLTYDEWGGFFDHVRPPLFLDDRASSSDNDNFAQAGFRVPTFLASPYAMPGGVDNRAYEHTAILRFLEWRFLGAPARGPGVVNARWALTARDRHSENMGITLRSTNPDVDLGFDIAMPIPQPSLSCSTTTPGHVPVAIPDAFDAPELADLMQSAFPKATHRPWLADLPGPLV